VWHLNLAFSSIELEQHSEVIQKCYWPLLNIVEQNDVKFGIEASGWTLSRIKDLDPAWIELLKALISQKKIEFVGSGWSQIIAPLVPFEVNRRNFNIGIIGTKEILESEPKIAFVNEQVWAPGLTQLYLDSGFDSVIMEWENPYSFNKNWEYAEKYRVQFVEAKTGRLKLLWNHSIAFQKMQRLAHGDITQDEWLEWITPELIGPDLEYLCIYGGDAETFGFRAKRFESEGNVDESEWERIESAFMVLLDKGIKFVLPSDIESDQYLQKKVLDLSNVTSPLPTKKQPKYNVLRWATGGRDAVLANTTCYNIYHLLMNSERYNESDWKILLELWGSDFRTHTTLAKWKIWISESEKLLARIEAKKIDKENINFAGNIFDYHFEDYYLVINSTEVYCKLNLNRGLAIDKASFKSLGSESLFGTMRHGMISDVAWSADFYSGEFVVEQPGKPKISDLIKVSPAVRCFDDSIEVSSSIMLEPGELRKIITVSSGEAPKIDFRYELYWETLPVSSIRLGDVVLNSDSFDRESLYFKSFNGGKYPDLYKLAGNYVDYGKPVSSLVSGHTCLGITTGDIVVGDRAKAIQISCDMQLSALPALITYTEDDLAYFMRIQFSAREIDDTSAKHSINLDGKPRIFSFSITPYTEKAEAYGR
jgi:hypothetical protein